MIREVFMFCQPLPMVGMQIPYHAICVALFLVLMVVNAGHKTLAAVLVRLIERFFLSCNLNAPFQDDDDWAGVLAISVVVVHRRRSLQMAIGRARCQAARYLYYRCNPFV